MLTSIYLLGLNTFSSRIHNILNNVNVKMEQTQLIHGTAELSIVSRLQTTNSVLYLIFMEYYS